jgi:Protein of unknown function (DUF2505)
MGHVSFELEHSCPADLDRLWATLGRPEHVECKYAALGSTNLRILAFDADEHVINVVLERQIRAPDGALPAWARPVFAGSQVLHHRTRWARVDARSASVELKIWPLGAPVRAYGHGAVIELSDGSTQMKMHVGVQCGVPIIGTRVAELFANQLKQALGQDHSFTLSYPELPKRSWRQRAATAV